MSEEKPVRVIRNSHAETIPMDPEDFAGLLAWVRAKEEREKFSA